MEQSARYTSTLRIRFLMSELVQAYKEEELFWKQMCKDNWTVKGDLNTKYYHASVKSNRSRRKIIKLMDDRGQEHFSEAAKGEVETEYFQKLFTSTNPGDFTSMFDGFTSRVTDCMNEKLSKEEVKAAIFSIKSCSAPGPDGMTGLFFQRYWSTVGDQVTKEVRDFFITGLFPTEWNYMHLCLLPNIEDPVLMSDLRPISLCSVQYKIILKILVLCHQHNLCLLRRGPLLTTS